MAENNTINNTEKKKYRGKNYSTKKYVSKISINENNIKTVENETVFALNPENVKVSSENIANDPKEICPDILSEDNTKDEVSIPETETESKVESKVEPKIVTSSKDLKVGKIIAKGPATITVMGEDGQGILLKGKCSAEIGEYLEYFR